jgi:hypothetical protein
MKFGKIALFSGFAVAAALASAPLASADDFTSIVDSDIASLNSIFESEASIAGDSGDVTTGGTGVLDTILPADAPVTAPLTTLDYELYGPLASLLIGVDNPVSGDPFLDPAPGAQDVANGALVEFDDAFNALVYEFVNDEALIPTTDLIGAADQAADVAAAGDGSSEVDLFGAFLNTGLDDLFPYLWVPIDA